MDDSTSPPVTALPTNDDSGVSKHVRFVGGHDSNSSSKKGAQQPSYDATTAAVLPNNVTRPAPLQAAENPYLQQRPRPPPTLALFVCPSYHELFPPLNNTNIILLQWVHPLPLPIKHDVCVGRIPVDPCSPSSNSTNQIIPTKTMSDSTSSGI